MTFLMSARVWTVVGPPLWLPMTLATWSGGTIVLPVTSKLVISGQIFCLKMNISWHLPFLPGMTLASTLWNNPDLRYNSYPSVSF